ncbi:hypothetical protein [Halomonas sp. AOP25-F1-15]|uniref:hypothetical protein n=1 Tax=Halomonas sp. AOP25-F1-15 TaxID=3457709 RepID=UPI004034B13E
MSFRKKIVRKYNEILDNTHSQTLIACFWMLLGSFLPILVDSAIKCWIFSISYSTAFLGNIRGGEVFILTTAMITPFFLLLIKKVTGRVNVRFKMFSWFFFFSLFSLIGGVLSFSYFRIGTIISSGETNLSEDDNEYLVDLFSYDLTLVGLLIYVISLIVWYYAAYHETPPSPENQYNNKVTSAQASLNDKIFDN